MGSTLLLQIIILQLTFGTLAKRPTTINVYNLTIKLIKYSKHSNIIEQHSSI